MHVCLWALGGLHQLSSPPYRSWRGDTMDIRIGTGDTDTGDMGPGAPGIITTAGTAVHVEPAVEVADDDVLDAVAIDIRDRG